MKLLPVVLVISAVILTLLDAQTTEQTKTQQLINRMQTTFPNQTIDQYMRCVIKPDCASCTGDLNCVWLSGSSTTSLTVTQSETQSVLFSSKEVNFCWWGSPTGHYIDTTWDNLKQISGFPQNGSSTTPKYDITVGFGFNDFNWKQCQMKGGAALVLAIVLPIAAAGACVCLIVGVVCCCVVNKALKPNRKRKKSSQRL